MARQVLSFSILLHRVRVPLSLSLYEFRSMSTPGATGQLLYRVARAASASAATCVLRASYKFPSGQSGVYECTFARCPLYPLLLACFGLVPFYDYTSVN